MKSTLVSAMGSGFEIIKALVNEIQRMGGTENDVRAILSNISLRERIAAELVSRPRIVWTGIVKVNHRMPLSDRIELMKLNMIQSKFDVIHEQFSIGDEIENVKLALVDCGSRSEVIWKDVLQEVACSPAGHEDLVAFGTEHRELVCRFEHVAATAGVQPSGEVCKIFAGLFWDNRLWHYGMSFTKGGFSFRHILCRMSAPS